MSNRLVTLPALFAAFFATTAVRADEPPDPNLLRETARLMHEAKVQADAGQFEVARQRYGQACALMATPRCLRSLAWTDLEAGHPVEALQHFRAEFADPQATTDLTPEKIKDDRDMMHDAYGKSGHLDIRAPEGATVAIDGRPLAAPLPADHVVDVVAGPHVVEARLAEQLAHLDVTATKGDVVVADLHLEPPTPTFTPPPPQAQPISPPADVTADLGVSAWWTTTRTAGALTAAGGAVSLTVSGLLASQSRHAHDTVQQDRPCNGACPALPDDADTENRARTLSWFFFGVGAAAVATGAVLFLWPTSSHRSITPLATSNGAGLQLTGDL